MYGVLSGAKVQINPETCKHLGRFIFEEDASRRMFRGVRSEEGGVRLQSGVRGRGGTGVRDMIGGDRGRWIGNRILNNFFI